MTYTPRTDWVDLPATTTPVMSADLLRIENGIAAVETEALAAAAAAQSASQPVDTDLTAIAALATTTYGRALLTMADAAATRTALALGTAATADASTFANAATTTTALAAKADLVAGLVPTNQIPALALTTSVVVASQAAMLALTTTQVQPGDLAIRTDGAGTFILTATDPTQLANWTRLNAPTDLVSSVNGQTGTVVLAATDVGAQPVDSDLTAIAALTTTTFGRSLLAMANAAAVIAALGLATVATTGAYADLTGKPTIPSETLTITTQAADYTLALTDAGTDVEGTKATAQTITVPPNSSVAFPVGTIINARQIGAGQITIAPGAGVTLRIPNGAKTAHQYSTLSLVQRVANEWVVAGDATT